MATSATLARHDATESRAGRPPHSFPKAAAVPAATWRRRHRAILILLWIHALGVIPVFAVFTSAGPFRGLAEAVPPTVLAVGATLPLPRRVRAILATLGLLLCSSALVHLSGGVIEAHFHFFAMLSVITAYQDWLAFVLAFAYVVADHGILGSIDPMSVYNHPAAWSSPWKWAAIHGFFVAATGAITLAAWWSAERERARADESERLRLRDSLRMSDEKLSEAQRLAQIGTWEWDLRLRKLTWSEQLAHNYALAPDETTFEALLDRVHPADVDAVGRAVERSMRTGEGFELDHRIVHPNGGIRIVHATGHPLRGEDGTVARIVGTSQDVTEQRLAEAAVRRYRDSLQTLSRRLVAAQEAERRRTARELHDEVGQLLTGLKLVLESADESMDPTGGSLARARALTEDLMAVVRDISHALLPPMLEDLGLPATLEWYFERQHALLGLRVTLVAHGLEGRRFPSVVETAAYRIIQEGLTNVARHAGVMEATVRIAVRGDLLVVEIDDHGIGFDPGDLPPTASGITGMRERAIALGGDLVVRSLAGGGTIVRATLPLGRGETG